MLLVAAPAAIAIGAAPSAWAAPSEQPCRSAAGTTHCQTPGNDQIYTSPQASGFPLQDFAPEPPSRAPSGGVHRDVAGAAKP
jgi:hypothetical protein